METKVEFKVLNEHARLPKGPIAEYPKRLPKRSWLITMKDGIRFVKKVSYIKQWPTTHENTSLFIIKSIKSNKRQNRHWNKNHYTDKVCTELKGRETCFAIYLTSLVLTESGSTYSTSIHVSLWAYISLRRHSESVKYSVLPSPRKGFLVLTNLKSKEQ